MKRDLSVYIHIPFCEKKCGYCDFYSFVPSKEETMERYVEMLAREAALYEEELRARNIRTIYIGGGTPSMLGSDRLLRAIEPLMPFVETGAEVTIEGNPESVRTLDVGALTTGGINRFSMGVQSGSDRLLDVMGRIHDVETARRAFDHLREGGAENINLDFISSVPTESDVDIEKSLALVESLDPEHVSVYSLIVEEGTPFYKQYGHLGTERDEEDRRHVHRYERRLERLSYAQYEISNFAKPGYRCRHNLHYWTLGEYIGLGAGSSGYLNGVRYRNETDMHQYGEKIARGVKPVAAYEKLTDLDRDNEYMMLGIRLNEGIPLDEPIPSGARFIDRYKAEIERNIERGLLEIRDERVALTARGRDLSNRVEVDFFRLSDEEA
ncbi:MAG: radical SAM family heme chaperone HemW [Peptoniphilus sp.]|nr:radical SAM family heme chaperone HemW [Peptoniphilus sp.]MDD7362758.1 radical SAM family heme chaperone HemW [Bacillota bacterium]MDY6044548.1 radical SAM family heme chaperone HemW [Peptoniphilus sp.]